MKLSQPGKLNEFFSRSAGLFDREYLKKKLNSFIENNNTEQNMLGNDAREERRGNLEKCCQIHNTPATFEKTKITTNYEDDVIKKTRIPIIQRSEEKGSSSYCMLFDQIDYVNDIREKKQKDIIASGVIITGRKKVEENGKIITDKSILFLGQAGLCYGLTLAWLARQGSPDSADFFDYIKTEAGYKEVVLRQMWQPYKYDTSSRIFIKYKEVPIFITKIKKSDFGVNNYYYSRQRDKKNHSEDKKKYTYTDTDYINDITGKVHQREDKINTLSTSDDVLPISDGRYHVTCLIKNRNSHSIGIFIDQKTDTFKLFDANYGEFSFCDLAHMKKSVLSWQLNIDHITSFKVI
ncbi:hypothetical protein [Candidatus Regiella endosymbiont of Tuberolachnus salignus]|uniref:hypothetical protein n=1 Tax=Candidatus Regiella endosymbiont of Tuberolachnus salignus TaxID=3077956 RepID=UPI0030D329F2